MLVNLAGLFFFALKMARTFGISAYFTDPTVIRLNYEDLGRIGALALLLLVNYPLFVCSLIHLLGTKKLRWFTAVGLCLPALQGYLTMSRNTLAIPVATSLFVWFYFRGWRTLSPKILMRSVLVLSLIAAYFIVVGLWYGKLASSENSAYKQQDFSVNSQIALQFMDPYIYATGNFPTLQEAMWDLRGRRLWGVRTFFPFARLFYAVGLLDERPENASLKFYFVPIPCNTYTYLFSLYEDFGAAGVVLLPFLTGWTATQFYLRMKAQPSIFSIGGAACFMVVILYSVFIALGSKFDVWYYLLLLYVISRRCAIGAHAALAGTKGSAYSATRLA